MHALIVATIAYIALNIFRLRPPFAMLAVLIAALNPAMWSRHATARSIPYLAQSPIFQTEIICAFLMLATFLALLRRRYILFALIATAAVCLKETALTAPVSALALTGLWLSTDQKQSLVRALCLATPLAVWFSARGLLFKHNTIPINLTPSTASATFLQPIRNALLLPSGLYQDSLGETRRLILAHQWHVPLLEGAQTH